MPEKPIPLPKQTFTLSMVITALVIFTGCPGNVSPPNGTYPPVQATQLIGKTTSQRTGKHDYDFKWSFSAQGFEIVGPRIPDDLTSALSGRDEVSSITGTWEIKNETILLSTQENGGPVQSSMKIFATGPIRIQSSDAQYVF